MIRINLLGAPKPKGSSKKASAVTVPSIDTGSLFGPALKVAAVLIIAGVFNTAYWYQLDREKKSIDAQMRQAEARTANWPISKRSIWNGKDRPTPTSAALMSLTNCAISRPVTRSIFCRRLAIR